MDRSYFNILDSIDPLFHSFVLTRIREIKEAEGMEEVTIEQLNEQDQLEVLRRYCLSLYTEFTTLRSFLLENMEVCTRSIRMKPIIR
jgi:hypothetical protein